MITNALAGQNFSEQNKKCVYTLITQQDAHQDTFHKFMPNNGGCAAWFNTFEKSTENQNVILLRKKVLSEKLNNRLCVKTK